MSYPNLIFIIFFVDFHESFDTVDHTLHLTKLANISINVNLLQSLLSYLLTWTQCIKVDNCISSVLPTNMGVPQSSIQVPAIYTAKLDCKVHEYAEDTTFCLPGRTVSLLQAGLHKTIRDVEGWCKTNKKVVNTSKLQFMVQNAPSSMSLTANIKDKPFAQKPTS